MMNNRVWIFGTIIASIAVIALGVVVGILPKLTETGANTVNLANVVAQNQAYEADLAALKVQFENIDDVRKKLAELQKSLPAGGAYPDIIAEIAELAAENGVQILETSQTAPIVYGATDAAETDSDTGTAATPISGGTLLAIPYVVRYDSTDRFAGLGFLNGLRLGNRLLLISDINYAVKERNSLLVYETTVSFFIYTLVDPSAVPVDSGAGDPPTDVPPAEETPAPTDTATGTPTPGVTETPAP